jgi:isopenicillin-N epimerase
MLCDRWAVEPVSPLDGSLLGSMATVRLPARLQGMSPDAGTSLQQRLYDAHHVEVPLIPWGGQWFLRVSCCVYNTPAQYERLAEVMRTLEV